MIVRIFRNRVKPGKQAEFETFFSTKAVANVRAHAGLVSVVSGGPREAGGDEYVMITVWRDLAALKAFAGENWQKPFIDPDEADLISDVSVTHYEGGLA